MKVLLVYPPVARSTEPPLGIARLAASLGSAGHRVACLDLNQECQEWLLGMEVPLEDTWSKGASRRREASLSTLRSPEGYANFDRYSRAVRDLSRLAGEAGRSAGGACPGGPPRIGLADYSEPLRSPVRRADLLDAAARPGTNPFHGHFANRLEDALRELGSGGRGPRSAEDDGSGFLLGISLAFLSQALSAFAIAGYARSRWPRLSILLGGGLVTSWLGQGLVGQDEDFGGLVDALVPGRGEDGLARWLALGAGEPRPRGPTQAETPEFGDFGHLGYLAPGRIIPYAFSTGCPWRNCAFCPETAEGQAYSPRRADDALRDLELLGKRWSPHLFHFTDNEVAPLYLRALARRGPGAAWYGFARFTAALGDARFCRDLAASGCVMLQLGLESGDQAVLDAMGKGTELGLIRRVFRNLEEAGIATYVYVLFGTPTEDRDAALRTRDFLEEESERIGWLNLAVFNMPARSAMAATLDSRPFYEGDLSLYAEFAHPLGWNRGEIRAFLREDVESSEAIKAILRRTPPVFTSNHAPFLVGQG